MRSWYWAALAFSGGLLLSAGGSRALVRETPIQGPLTLANFRLGSVDCYDRGKQQAMAVVDAHLHVRPFGGPAVPFDELIGYLSRSGVLFANLYGIGQRLPVDSSCTYYLNCPGVPALPSLKSDFSNAQNLLDLAGRKDIKLMLSMTFPDLAKPEDVLWQMALLNKEFPGMFRWMGEVNLAKQALYNNGHQAVAKEKIAAWKPFMDELRRRDIPIAIHSDFGNDKTPFLYLPLMEEVLRRYPDNRIVWMHLGLSKELSSIAPQQHVAILEGFLRRYPKLSFDISWRVLYDQAFKDPAMRKPYVELINRWPDRFIPGTDFVAAAGKTEQVYKEELLVTSAILGEVSDEAYRRIALGGNYFRLAGLDAIAPQICKP